MQFLLQSFAARAERLADGAMRGGDAETAEGILTLVLKLIPGRGPAEKLLAKLTNTPPTVNRLPILSSKWVECRKGNLKQGVVRRTRTTAEIEGVKTEADPYEPSLTVRFTPLVWGKSIRATWRVRQIWPSPRGQRGMMFVSCPLGGAEYSKWIAIGPRWAVAIPKGCDNKFVDKKLLSGLYREDGTYEITCCKEGPTFTVLVQGKELVRIKMSKAQDRAASGMPFELKLYTKVPDGEKVHLRAALLDFSCSSDCIRKQ